MCSLNPPNSTTGMLLSPNAFHHPPLRDPRMQVKQSASLPPAFQPRPQGPPSAAPQRFPTNNGSSGPRLGGPQPPSLRRLDSRSSLVPGQRPGSPFGPTSLQGQPPRPQGFPQRAPQPQLFPGQNQGYQNSPGAGPPKRFPSGPPQGPRPQNQPGPRSLATAGQPHRPQVNQPPLGPNSSQFNAVRPQGFPQRTPSQSSIRSDSPDSSRPGTPSAAGRLSSIFPQRQLMSGPEALPPQTNNDSSRELRNDLSLSNDSPLLQRNPLDPKNAERTAGGKEEKLKDLIGGDDKMAENINGKPKMPINADDDDDVVVDSGNSKEKTEHQERQGDDRSVYLTKENERSDSSMSQQGPISPGVKSNEKRDIEHPDNMLERKSSEDSILHGVPESNLINESGLSHDAKALTPEPSKTPQPREEEPESMKTEDKLPPKGEKFDSPIPRSPGNLSSPIPEKSLESTPGNSPKPRGEREATPPIENQEFDERLSVSGSPKASPKSSHPNVIGFDDGNERPLSSKSPASSSAPSPNPPKSPSFASPSPSLQNAPVSPVTRSPVSTKSPVSSVKSPTSTPQSPNPPKSPGCLRSSEGEKSGRSTPDTEGAKKRATFAKDLIMSGANKDDESTASVASELKDLEFTTPEESSKGTPTTPSKGTPGTPKKSFSPSSVDRSRHRSRSPKSDVGKSPEKESAASRNRTARESKERNTASANRSRKTDGDNDSGVDESTQGNELTTNGDAGSPTKSHSKIPGPKRSTSSSPTKSPSKSVKGLPKTPDTSVAPSASADKKKVPMNKIQVGAAPSPNLKTVRSKIGSLENTSYKPGGGKIKIENRKLDFSKAQPKIAAKNDKYMPSGGDKKITQVKLQWNAKPKVGSLENSTYKPGGGDKKIETVKLDFKEKAKPKVASKDNVKHVPGGGTVKSSTTPPETPQKVSDDIETVKIEVKAESKVHSLDNVKHKPGGGDKKIFNDKDYLRQTSSNVESLSGSGSQEGKANVALNVTSPSSARKTKKLSHAEDSSTPSSQEANPINPVATTESTIPARAKSRSEQVPVPPTTTPVEEKKAFPQSRKSSLVKTPDRSKTPEHSKKVTIAESEDVRQIETKRSPKSPTEKRPKTPEERRPKTPEEKRPKTPEEKKPKTPEEKRPSTPRHETGAQKTPDAENKPSTPRLKSPLKKSPNEERQKSPGKKSPAKNSPTSPVGKVTPRKERSSPPNSLPLNNTEDANEKLSNSSSKEFRLPKIVSSMLPELGSHDPVIATPASDSKIALPKLVDAPIPPSRTGVAQ
ncbi:microtubule-associated protein futsch isoform X1 [Neodiprion pinetum]|uniref:microtubule-associated protein futsch isoform X1 n=1 Tax=Neodiprion pinetum TaxID=441929 RepID=UPI001EDCE3B4|nr:serine/arginine repetitive matrix protein 2 isoform X3 [Neodiprion pinetum]